MVSFINSWKFSWDYDSYIYSKDPTWAKCNMYIDMAVYWTSVTQIISDRVPLSDTAQNNET